MQTIAQRKYMMRSFLIGLVSLILLLSLLTGYAYSFTRASALRTIDELNESLTRQADDFTEQFCAMVSSYAGNVFNSRSIKKLRRSETLSNSDFIGCMRDLRTYASSTEYIHSIYVYNALQDYVYTTLDSDLAKGSASADRYFDRESVLLMRAGNLSSPVHRSFPYGGMDSYVLSFVMAERSRDSGRVENAMIVNVSMRWLARFLKTFYLMENTALYLEDGTALIPDAAFTLPREDAVAMIRAAEEQSESRTLIRTVQNRRMLCFCVRSSNTGSYFIRAVPYQQAMRGPLALQRRLAVMILGIAALGLCICAFLSRRFSLPFRKLLPRLPGADEWMTLPASLNDLVDLAGDELEKYRALAKEEYLRQLLLFLPTEPLTQRDLDRRGIGMRLRDPVCPVLLSPDAPAESALLPEGLLCEEASVNSVRILLLQGESAKLSAFLSAQAERTAFCACSEPTDFSALHRCYAALRELYELRIFLPERRIHSEQSLYLRGDTLYPKRIEQRLIAALAAGNAEKAAALLEEFLSQIEEHSRYAVLKAHLAQLYCSVAEQDRSGTLEDADPQIFFEVNLSSCESRKELLAFYQVLFQRIAEQNVRLRQEREAQLVERVKAFLEANYMDAEITPQSIAEAEGIQAEQLSELFRNGTGLPIPKYLLQLRLRKAAQLLCSTSLPVKEIAKMVGFSNPQYFFTLFKTAYGLTPSGYREANFS